MNDNLSTIMNVGQKSTGGVGLTLIGIAAVLAMGGDTSSTFWILIGVGLFLSSGAGIITAIKSGVKNKVKDQKVDFQNSIFFTSMRQWIMQLDNLSDSDFVNQNDLKVYKKEIEKRELEIDIDSIELANIKKRVIKTFLLDRFISFYLYVALYLDDNIKYILDDDNDMDIDTIIPTLLKWLNTLMTRAKDCIIPPTFVVIYQNHFEKNIDCFIRKIRQIKSAPNMRYNREKIAALLIFGVDMFADVMEKLHTEVVKLNGSFIISLLDLNKAKLEGCYLKQKALARQFFDIKHEDFIKQYKNDLNLI